MSLFSRNLTRRTSQYTDNNLSRQFQDDFEFLKNQCCYSYPLSDRNWESVRSYLQGRYTHLDEPTFNYYFNQLQG